MINITEYGLIEQDITRSYFTHLTEIGQQVYCSEMAKTKKRASHCFTYLLTGELKNVYWVLENDELERVTDFISRKLGTVIEVNEMPDTPEKQAGLEAYRWQCIETEKMWASREKNTSKGVMNNAGANNIN